MCVRVCLSPPLSAQGSPVHSRAGVQALLPLGLLALALTTLTSVSCSRLWMAGELEGCLTPAQQQRAAATCETSRSQGDFLQKCY